MEINPTAHVIISADAFGKVIQALELGRIACSRVAPHVVSDIDFATKRLKETAVSLKSPIKIDTRQLF